MHLLRRILLVVPLVLAACQTPVDESALARYYAAAEAELRANGMMQGAPTANDPTFSTSDLVRNFKQIALFDEYTIHDGRYVARQSRTHLRRWEGPVRVGVMFGESNQNVRRDTAEVRRYTRRLAQLTGLDMRLASNAAPNFLVVFLNAEERHNFALTLPERYPNIEPAVIDAFANSPHEIFCAAISFTKEGAVGVYDQALILVKSEHSDAMRKSCIEEEMAQALGLTNDSPEARPSIFNDTKEFAFLTTHDAFLLQMLYDPRLKAGMMASEVSPLLPSIARDVVGGGI